MRRLRRVKIVATLGPASNEEKVIEELARAGADVFRINMSHANHDLLKQTVERIRNVEKTLNHPFGVLVDLQGPKLRVGTFDGGSVQLVAGDSFTLDSSSEKGSRARVNLPHPEILEAVSVGDRLLLDDGKVELRATRVGGGSVDTSVIHGGKLSDKKGVSLPDTLIGVGALSEKDHADLLKALEVEADWIALSFVQRPEDIIEVRKVVQGRAGVMAKIEKPQAVERLEEIIKLCDAFMIARGDLGVELPIEQVPGLQKRMIRIARRYGKPVVVATQMLESMITSPVPTRAEVSDVSIAVFEGADAIMLSAESASGQFPCEAVEMMNRIATSAEDDPTHYARVHFTETLPDATTNDAIARSAADMVRTVSASAIVCLTSSGSTARRVARERPTVPLLVLTPSLKTARRLGILWGAHAVRTRDVHSFEEMVGKSKRMALRHGLGKSGDRIIVTAGVPFGVPGSTNVVHVSRLLGDELDRHRES
jgi:pyruvate kinase